MYLVAHWQPVSVLSCHHSSGGPSIQQPTDPGDWYEFPAELLLGSLGMVLAPLPLNVVTSPSHTE